MKETFKKAALAAVGTALAMSASAAAPTTLTQPDWSRNAVIYEVNWRQMTPEGTLKALEGQLPRLKDLGVDILWLMPIHPISELNRKGELGSYYASANYKEVNPELGTIDEFRHFVKEAHDMGFKVIIDWVPNHTGCDNWWVTYHPEYYRTDASGKPESHPDWTDIYQLNYANPATRRAMIDAMTFWLYEADIDGFRCDVAGVVPTDFWNEARPALEAAKPGLFMLAEAAKPELQEHAFNMGYNWPLSSLLKEVANGAGQYNVAAYPLNVTKTAVDIDSLFAQQARTYPADTYNMNMITNHDYNSWEGPEFERFGNLTDAMAVLTYTLPGMPLIYTGQETGMNRAFEFFKKDTAPDFEPRNEYFTLYQKLNALKHNEAALLAGLAGGEMKSYSTKSRDILAFSRQKGDSEIFVICNLGAKDQKVKFTADKPNVAGMVNYFTDEPAKLPSKLAPGEYRLFVRTH